MGECEECPPGSYCDDTDGTSVPEDCTTSNYCPAGTETPITCPDGTYTEVNQSGLESVDQCAACPTGYYCENGVYDRSKPCDAGFFCLTGASLPDSDDDLCPSGFFCISGSKVPTACEEGKYSLPGAETADDCIDCIAGYYCVIGVSTTQLNICPAGHYCPPGENQPKQCKKGTYNRAEKAEEEEDCKDCPKGTACDKTGIVDYEDHKCPPGYYCPEDSYIKISCPVGTFNPIQGAYSPGPILYTNRFKSTRGCISCPAGFYCPKEATKIPELCEPGKYCPMNSEWPIECDAGYYCTAGSADQTPCPPGFFCTGGSEVMKKCQFGTYCPPKSAFEIPCPDGTYGSGNVNNFDVDSACYSCGRGLYSTSDNPNECLDCTEGYVCLGRTSSKFPAGIARDRGYKCPLGNYCPTGSYEPTACPIGYYAKYLGVTSEEGCIKCKRNTY